MRRHPLLGFFILAFVLSWSIWPFVLLNPDSNPVFPFGPLLAALIMVAVTGGWRGIRALLASLVRWRVPPRFYAVALLLPAVPVLVAVAAHFMLGAPSPTAADLDGWWYLLPVTLVSTLLVNGPLGEEPGWRGFALSRLQARFGVLPATISLGVLWALWHLPLSLSGPTTDQRPPLQFALSLVAMSFLYSWLAARTSGSVLLAMLLHASTNTVAGFFFRTYGEVPGYGRLWWCYVGAWSVVALVLLGRGLARRRTTPAAPGLLTADLRARQKESGLTMEHS